jgi:hypothetical protein
MSCSVAPEYLGMISARGKLDEWVGLAAPFINHDQVRFCGNIVGAAIGLLATTDAAA